MTINESLIAMFEALGFGKKKHSKQANIDARTKTALLSLTASEHPKAHRALMNDGYRGRKHASSNMELRAKLGVPPATTNSSL